jgi:hypothetical protein
MAVDFRDVEIWFDPTANQEQHEEKLVQFDRQVRRASAALKAIAIGFTEHDDHPIWRLAVNINKVEPSGQDVNVGVTYLLTDKTGYVEDTYDGRVEVMVIAEVAD